MLKIPANHKGFEDLEAWMVRHGEPVTSVVMESSGHY